MGSVSPNFLAGPCNDGYTKLDGACAIACGSGNGRCYNTTDVRTNEPACCLNNNILPISEFWILLDKMIPRKTWLSKRNKPCSV